MANGQPILEYLRGELASRQQRNPRYSVRALAKSIQLESSVVSQLLSGKRPLTFDLARRILNTLGVEESRRNTLLLSLDNPGNAPAIDIPRRTLREDELARIATWHAYAISCLLDFTDPPRTAAAIAERLGLTEAEAKAHINTLLDLNIIERTEAGFAPVQVCLTTENGVRSQALIAAHLSCIGAAADYLRANQDPEREVSDISGMTFKCPASKVPEARRRIREFRRSLSRFLSHADGPEEVYRLNIQLFPLSQSPKRSSRGNRRP